MNANCARTIFSVILLPVVLTACSSGADLSDVKNEELTDQAYRCGLNKNPAPGYAISCENIRRECQRRSAEFGYKLC
ncbi:MAG: hypothetical protein KDI36_02010 [Pseudomonadales bacterium]|nr:hypothetical protein [Pseudomonadales bacterium]